MPLVRLLEMRLTADDKKTLVIILVSSVAWAAFGLLSVELYSDDDLGHYMIARYSALHPHLFLDIWGRPLFTVLYAVGSQFGLAGARLTSTVLAAAVIWFTYIYARESGIRRPWMVAMLLVVMPRFSSMAWNLDTGMALCLALSAGLALYAKGRYAAAAAAISLAPAGRPEGVLFIMIFGVVLLYRRQWKAIPFLFLGLALWDAAGLLMSGDPLWLLHNQPWTVPYPEKFGLDHYFKRFTEIIGPAHVPFFLAGLIVSIKRFKKGDNAALAAMWLIYFVFMVVVVWRGAFSTVGLTRYFNGTTPLVALLALAGIDWMFDAGYGAADIVTAALLIVAGVFLGINGAAEFLTAAAAAGFLITVRGLVLLRIDTKRLELATVAGIVLVTVLGFAAFRPTALSPQHSALKKAAEGYSADYKGRPTLSSDIWFSLFAGRDPYDPAENKGVSRKSLDNAAPGTIVVWEPHYAGGKRYGDIDPNALLSDGRYKPVWGDEQSGVLIFEKVGGGPSTADR